MGRPTFIVAGAHRGGTTSLYHYAASHPDIHVSPIKETNYLLIRSGGRPDLDLLDAEDLKRLPERPVCSEAEYERLFPEPQRGRASGEFSPAYLQNPSSADVMKSYLPGVRVVLVLRNPVHRAFSHYTQHRRSGMWPETDFVSLCERVVVHGEDVRAGGHGYPARLYFQTGLYADRVERFVAVLGSSNLLLQAFDDLVIDPRAFLKVFVKFIGVTSDDGALRAIDTGIRHNASGVARSEWRDKVLAIPTRASRVKGWMKRAIPPQVWQPLVRVRNKLQTENLERVETPERAVALLREHYKADVGRLSEVVGRDFTHWTA